MNEKYGIPHLLEIVREIEKTPSQLHCKCRHKNAPQTPDFDWNALVNRIDKMQQQDRIANSPFRQAQLALSALSADFTYENRGRAKTILHNMMDTLKSQEERSIMMNKTDREFTQKFENKLRTSTYLTDEFWTNIVADAKKCKCKCHEESSNTISPRTNNGILHNEQLRYNRILSSCSAI